MGTIGIVHRTEGRRSCLIKGALTQMKLKIRPFGSTLCYKTVPYIVTSVSTTERRRTTTIVAWRKPTGACIIPLTSTTLNFGTSSAQLHSEVLASVPRLLNLEAPLLGIRLCSAGTLVKGLRKYSSASTDRITSWALRQSWMHPDFYPRAATSRSHASSVFAP